MISARDRLRLLTAIADLLEILRSNGFKSLDEATPEKVLGVTTLELEKILPAPKEGEGFGNTIEVIREYVKIETKKLR